MCILFSALKIYLSIYILFFFTGSFVTERHVFLFEGVRLCLPIFFFVLYHATHFYFTCVTTYIFYFIYLLFLHCVFDVCPDELQQIGDQVAPQFGLEISSGACFQAWVCFFYIILFIYSFIFGFWGFQFAFFGAWYFAIFNQVLFADLFLVRGSFFVLSINASSWVIYWDTQWAGAYDFFP